MFVCPHPHILPTQLQLPPHPAQPGAGSSCGGTRTRDPLWHLSLSAPGASALVLTSGPRHPDSQHYCRALLCHTELDSGGLGYLSLTSALPRSGVVGAHDYRCRNEVLSRRVCTTLTHTATHTHLLSAFHASSAKLCIPAGAQELGRKSTLGTKPSQLVRPEETGTGGSVPPSR